MSEKKNNDNNSNESNDNKESNVSPIEIKVNDDYYKIKNMSSQQILIKKLSLYKDLFILINQNFYQNEFEIFRAHISKSIVFFGVSQASILSFFFNNPLKSNFMYISLICSLGIIFIGYFKNIQLLCGMNDDDFSGYIRKNIKNEVKDLNNKISLYSPLRRKF